MDIKMVNDSYVPNFPDFELVEIDELYQVGGFEKLSNIFFDVLGFFRANTAFYISSGELNYICNFMNAFLYIFCDSRFLVNHADEKRYISFNNVISNLLSITGIKNSDKYIEKLINEKHDLVKILTIYSARNEIFLDASRFFDEDAALASYWYSVYSCCFYSGLVDKLVCKNLERHFSLRHKNLKPIEEIQVLYFGSTYLDGVVDRYVKTMVNEVTKEKVCREIVCNKKQRNFKKMGVFTLSWRKNHSVYRNYWAYLCHLREYYELIFFKLKEDSECDVGLFHQVYEFDSLENMLNHETFLNNDCGLFYFPDVGMNYESIVLANCRIAPIQICSPGHSVSTYGSEIDYFVSGMDVEVISAAKKNYSERLVLIPGMGVIHNKPDYQKKGCVVGNSSSVIINCSWHAQKINHNFVMVIKKMVAGFHRKVKLRIFLGDSTSKQNDHISFVASLISQLGTNFIEVYAGLSYGDYMTMMEQGDLSIESFHFGGCNTVSDSLYLGIPMVTLEGDRWYNRIGSQMLRVAGLNECVATSENSFIDKVTRLVHDDIYRNSLRHLISNTNLDETIYCQKNAIFFRKAIDHLKDNHSDLIHDAHYDPVTIV